jgi:hypothetical protein
LELAETIDKHVPKKGNGPSVGHYLTTAAINRCVAPRSKAKLGEWFEGTALRKMMSIQTKQLTSQRFWDNMDRVSSEAIAKIEEELTAKMVKDFDIDLRQVLFDGTNFFTFIDTFNERCTIAQRGKSKEGRRALRIVGLALLVSADFHVPLFHRTYPGNEVDAPTFNGLVADLSARYKAICEEGKMSPSSSTRATTPKTTWRWWRRAPIALSDPWCRRTTMICSRFPPNGIGRSQTKVSKGCAPFAPKKKSSESAAPCW